MDSHRRPDSVTDLLKELALAAVKALPKPSPDVLEQDGGADCHEWHWRTPAQITTPRLSRGAGDGAPIRRKHEIRTAVRISNPVAA